MKVKFSRYWFSCSLIAATLFSVFLQPATAPGAQGGQKELLKMTVGYTPIAGATLPFFLAVEEKNFQRHGLELSPAFMGGSPLINATLLAGEFPIGYTDDCACLSSR